MKPKIVKPKPWTAKEKKEIARLRKKGHDDGYIHGYMKVGNNRKGICPPIRSKKMATKKTTSKKKGSKKKKTTAGKKPAGTRGRTKGTFLGDTITAVAGKDEKFYKQFPRYAAYQLLCKKKVMKTSTFVDNVERLPDVKNRAQALGILTKLVEKGCAVTSGEKKAA